MPDMESPEQTRKELHTAAWELIKQLKELTAATNKVINTLISEGDVMVKDVADEIGHKRRKKVKTVAYSEGEDFDSAREAGTPYVEEDEAIRNLVNKYGKTGGRKCGKCGQTGHNARTCQ